MSTYPQRVWENILPLSVGDTLPKAFEEWSFTEAVFDNEQATETCQLCNQESLRYQFEIRNALTSKTLWVGSQCILRFSLSVFEAGRLLSSSDSEKKLERLKQKMRLDSCIRALEKLAAAEDNKILSSALTYYRTNKYLSPKFAFVVLWRLKESDIDHSPSFFKVSLKRAKYQQDLREMRLSRVHMIWPALSSSQRDMALSMGHTAPP
ncbi:hypothetical protein C5U62_20210 [Pseudomonas protegens]|uniref:Uncharacterized protein n=1 Tax=Pseudomonas protegens TaxID=380021 RepID=A0A2T6GJH0_9PSED|nr:hypothetical protein [Pseudomonas protegens]PUA44283.1 hypothetical protein C5U62_20210 [Pseudomonas protegens]